MPATIIWDTMEGSELEVSGLAGRQLVTGQIKDIPVDGEADSQVLNKALNIINASSRPMGSSHPSGNGLKSTRLLIRPHRLSSRVRFEMTYESGQFTNPSSYFIRNSSAMTTFTTRFLPGSNRGKRIACSWTDPVNPGYVIRSQSISMTMLRPTRVITVSGLVYGNPPPGITDGIGFVNDGTWQGKRTGYWLVTALETDVAKYSGYYTYQMSASTKGNEDWSDYAEIVDPLTGLPVKIDEAELQASLVADYAYDVIPGNGFVRVGGYETRDFPALFGIS